jgi:alkanesulfonate monooxygenase SsuD/methylene tetrahydromethanopterin reductase-like flavin-dependent oxidoreductase (luciferase family)
MASVATPLRFGVIAFQALPYAELKDDARFAERIGLDVVWLADQAVPPELPILEAWTALAALAVDTHQIGIGTLVTNVAMRNPLVMARQALTVDQISAGRLEVGIGAGYYQEDHRWTGIDFLDGRGRVQRLIEAAEILDRALRGERVTFDGVYFRLDDGPAIPSPSRRPRPPLWVAGHATGSMRVAARLGDAICTFGDPDMTTEQTLPQLRARMSRLDELCAEVGREPATLRRGYVAGFAKEDIFSSLDAAADFIGRFSEAGVTDFVFTLYNPAQPAFANSVETGQIATRDQLERVCAELLPRARN